MPAGTSRGRAPLDIPGCQGGDNGGSIEIGMAVSVSVSETAVYKSVGLTVVTLTVGVIKYDVFFEYQNQGIFNRTVFFFLTVHPRCHIDACFWHPKTKMPCMEE